MNASPSQFHCAKLIRSLLSTAALFPTLIADLCRSARSMKIRLLCVVATIAMIATAAAEVYKTLPDLSEGFPSVERFLESKDKDIETHEYVTRLEFTQVKEQFLTFLGDGWSEVPSESTKHAGRAKGQHLTVTGKCRFSNPAFPNIEISLTQFGSDAQPYDAVAIVFTRKKAEPGGPANGSQPVRSGTNRTSSAAGSRR